MRHGSTCVTRNRFPDAVLDDEDFCDMQLRRTDNPFLSPTGVIYFWTTHPRFAPSPVGRSMLKRRAEGEHAEDVRRGRELVEDVSPGGELVEDVSPGGELVEDVSPGGELVEVVFARESTLRTLSAVESRSRMCPCGERAC
ncbi:hypothetical protein BDZ89DRAFT_799057 [Hymenopellis radicata]|nr:hypothetical protein BDZ89DRAFT_799057 [Hymenopellis radicata]